MRVLQILASLNKNSGVTNVVVNWQRNLPDGVSFDYVILSKMETTYESEVMAAGSEVYFIKKPGLRTLFKFRRELDGFFKEHGEKYDIIHCHEITVAGMVFAAAKKHCKAKTILHIHNTKYSSNPLKALRNMIFAGKGKRLANIKLACGSLAGEKLYGKNADFRVLINPIDASRLAAPDEADVKRTREELRIPDGAYVIGDIARLIREKNQTFLIDVFCELAREDKTAVLLLVGDGPDGEAIRSYAKNSPAGDRIIFTGIRSDVNVMYALMDVFAFPSLFEGLPLGMIEAQYTGLPAVCSDRITKECVLSNCTVLPLDKAAWVRALAARPCGGDVSGECERFFVANVVGELTDIYNGAV